MRYLTPKEKVALMNSVSAQNMDDLLSQRQMALRIGISPPQHLNAFLTGRIAIPYKAIEEILWYIEDNVEISPEEEKQRIIKSDGYEKH